MSSISTEMCMLSIQGDCLSKEDRAMLKEATIYTMDYLLPKTERGDYRLIIEVRRANLEQVEAKNKASTSCNFGRSGRKTIRIWLDEAIIHNQCKTTFGRLKMTLQDLMHELIHAKQFLKGELVDLSNNYYKFCGKRYKVPSDDDEMGYYEQPYEIEAYGREKGLFKRFEKKLKEDGNE